MFLLLAGLLLAVLPGCSNELDVNAEPEDIYVVYGVLNPSDSVQVIRLARAYLIDGNLVAYGAQNDLSIKGATITLDNLGSSLEPVITLQERDTLKQTGDFFPQHSVYVTRSAIAQGAPYRLTVTLPGGDKVLTAETVVPTRPRITDPDSIRQGTQGTGAEDWSTAGFNDTDFQVRYIPRNLFTTGQLGIGFELRIYLKYSLDGIEQPTLRYGPGAPLTMLPGASFGLFNIGQGFQTYLQSKLASLEGTKTVDTGQKSESCWLEVTALDQHLYNYIRINSPAFVDFNAIRPNYTNIEGGIGLFGSINIGKRYVHLPRCTKYLCGINGEPMPSDPCPATE